MHTMRSVWGCLGTATFAATIAWSNAAAAHIEIVVPDSRYGPDMIKDAPCGHPDNPPGTAEPHVYQTGETITIVVNEFVAHEGHLRIAWAENDEDIVTINGFDDFDNFPGVLMDNIIDEPGMSQFAIELTLPSEECENCTLQVIQVMYDGDGFQEDDLYYTCADITLLDVIPGDEDSGGADETDDDGPDDGGPDDGGPADGPDDGSGADGADDGGTTANGSDGSDGTGGGADGGSSDGGGCSLGGGTHGLPIGGLACALLVLGLRARRRD